MRTLAHHAWRRRWTGVGAAWLVCLLGWGIVLATPPQYRSSGLVSVAPAAIAGPWRAEFRAALSAADRAEALRGLLRAPSTLRDALEATGTVEEAGPAASRVSALDVQPEGGARFRIALRHAEPDGARRLLGRLIEAARHRLKPPGADAAAADGTARDRVGALERELAALEDEIAAFEAEHARHLVPAPGLRLRLQAAEAALADLEARLAAAGARRATLAQRLAGAPPTLGADGASPPPAVRPIPNPVFTQLQIRLARADAELAGLRAERPHRAAAAGRLAEVVREAPAVRARLDRLERTRRATLAGLDAARATLRSAEAGSRASPPAIRVLEPPGLPAAPDGPPRWLQLAGVLIAGGAGGVALAAWRGASERVVVDPGGLQRALELPLLGSIGLVPTAAERRRRRRAGAGLALAGLGLLAVFGALIAAERAVRLDPPAPPFVIEPGGPGR